MLSNQEKVELEKWLSVREKIIDIKAGCFFVFSDPTRVKIVALLLKHGELCTSDMADCIGISLSAVSHQMRMFEERNLVIREKHGQHVCYTLSDEATGCQEAIAEIKHLLVD